MSKFSKLEKIYALNFYILVLFFICSLNLIILVLIYLLPDYLSTFDYFFEEILKNKYRYATVGGSLYRVSFFIGEPSYASIYIIPIFTYLLLNSFLVSNKIFCLRNLMISIFFLNILLFSSTTGIISLTIILFILFALNLKLKKTYYFFLFLLFLSILFFIFNSDLIISILENSLSKFRTENFKSSIWVRLWSIQHSFTLFLTSPFFGMGIGTSVATSGVVVFLASFGLIGTTLFFKMINLNKILIFFVARKDEIQYIHAFTILSLVICNFIAGDITTILSPILFLFISIISEKRNYS